MRFFTQAPNMRRRASRGRARAEAAQLKGRIKRKVHQQKEAKAFADSGHDHVTLPGMACIRGRSWEGEQGKPGRARAPVSKTQLFTQRLISVVMLVASRDRVPDAAAT